ncbi:hypothetical protein B7486_66770, partial [cyanobacterium TDX16]
PSGLELLDHREKNPFEVKKLDATFPVSEGPAGLRAAIDRLCDEAERAVRDEEVGIVIIDDGAVSPVRAPVPSLLATGAVHHRLTQAFLRSNTSLVVASDDARDVHAIACLLGYGADAVCPRLALQSVADEADRSEDQVSAEAQQRYEAAVEGGVLKILSKMGISTIDSYRGAQIFEVIGLGPEVVDVCLKGTPSVVGGIGWQALGEDVMTRHREAYPAEGKVDLGSPGYYRDRKNGEYHAHDAEVVAKLNALTLVKPERSK